MIDAPEPETPPERTIPPASDRWRRAAVTLAARRRCGPAWTRVAEAHARPLLEPARRAGLTRDAAGQPPAEDPAENEGYGTSEWRWPSSPSREGREPLEGAVLPPERRSAVRDLAPSTQAFISRFIGRTVAPVRLHTGVVADRVSRRHDADAVTTPDGVFFRAGRFDPASREGLALIGHELTHVAQLRGDRRATGRQSVSNVHREAEAQRIERTMLGGPAAPAAPAIPAAPMAPPPSAPAAPVLTASRSREVGGMEPAARGLNERDLMLIKEEVYRDLRARLRVEFERGA